MKQFFHQVFYQKKIFWLTILFTFLCGTLLGTASEAKEISNRFVRFHIIANSNSEEDQAVKWNVREQIFLQLDLSHITSKETALQYFREHQEEIEILANKVLSDSGYPYQCSVTVEKREFPVREYSDFVLPAGVYDSVCVTLGQGKGENFFCVMYPSLCMIEGVTEQADSNAEILNNVLTEKEAAFITGNQKQIVCKFKIVELFEKIFS